MDVKKAQQVVKEIQDAGGIVAFYKVDITNKTQIESAASDVEEKFGAITSWVNSAGVSKMLPFLDCDEDAPAGFWPPNSPISSPSANPASVVNEKYFFPNNAGITDTAIAIQNIF